MGISTTVMKCKKCDLIFANPLPIPANIEQHYGIPPESYWSAEYFKIRDDYFIKQIQTFSDLYGRTNDLRALDIGAGIGKCMIALENSGFEVWGLEPSNPFYEKALQTMKIEPSKLQLSTIENAVYEKESFDFITFGAVLEHLYNPSEAIQKAAYWLKPKGFIHIEVPSSNWLISRIANFVYKLQGLDYVTNISPMHSPFHLYEFGLKSFKENAKKHHYSIAHYSYEVCTTYLPKSLNKIFVPYMRATNTGMQLEIWLTKN
ncbi:class I SAM-dependent methyltransferase [Rhodocytophaga rosea]|uniref:Class I SAM-dependent methyltransferase n=1 Tax=Rhodocytophaga rosea TaxID=2704465 RepID=A0A6C0GR64_9BACT|nr:class I SAM-dependent methyltransferase [Rhodocytophaga rosea]QHT70559.1 class I SAM-dependent methyltransferase [Rhodocytophaga rosea]